MRTGVLAGIAAVVSALAGGLPSALVFTQTPLKSKDGRSRIARLAPDGTVKVLSAGLYAASAPEVSFDGKRILFAGKKDPAASWQIYELEADGSGLRQVTHEAMDCRNPIYLTPLYVISSEQPSHRICFVGSAAGGLSSLYTVQVDGTGTQRVSYSPGGDSDPFLMEDGRILFSSGGPTRKSIFGINLDGTDYALFVGPEGAPFKRMPAVTAGRTLVFVENATAQDTGGPLAAVDLRRPLHSYRRLNEGRDVFNSPAPLPTGEILVARLLRGGYGLFRLDPSTGKSTLVYDNPRWNDTQAKPLAPRPRPDGRSSVVDEKDPNGVLYCMNVRTTDLATPEWMPPGLARRLRVLEGMPGQDKEKAPATRMIGELNIEDDGSFQIRVPANTPIQLQLLDENGMALRACRWIWVRNHEPRGCIGCHEDPDLTPENRMALALTKPPAALTLPPERRRTVTFSRDVAPIISSKCANGSCHGSGDLRSHVAGMARTSPLVWRLFGHKTTRPWDQADGEAAVKVMPPDGASPLTEDEKRTIIEWIDMGAQQ